MNFDRHYYNDSVTKAAASQKGVIGLFPEWTELESRDIEAI
jgi:hypothetical protein